MEPKNFRETIIQKRAKQKAYERAFLFGLFTLIFLTAVLWGKLQLVELTPEQQQDAVMEIYRSENMHLAADRGGCPPRPGDPDYHNK